MRNSGLVRMSLFSLSLIVCAAAPVQQSNGQPTYITFDAPGAGTGLDEGTVPYCINGLGVIAGYYFDSSRTAHGFIRDAAGNFTTVDVPGAGSAGTWPISINAEGAITGG